MSKPAAWPPAFRGGRPLPESVRAFLFESERRVLLHCQTLLVQQNLPGGERLRSLWLATAAEEDLAAGPDSLAADATH